MRMQKAYTVANSKHIKILRQGVRVWNDWRRDHPKIAPDLSGADLSEIDLSHAYLNDVDLQDANLSYGKFSCAYLVRANLKRAKLQRALFDGTAMNSVDLSYADMRICNLWGSDLRFADLRRARMAQSDLTASSFVFANLSNTDLRRTKLSTVDFQAADLYKANVGSAMMDRTILAEIDLRSVKGLETVTHIGPSTIGLDTIYRSLGNIPENFLRGAGVPENFITFMQSLVGQPVDYYSCFISHSSKDEAFAERLHNDLRAKGVRCWYAPDDLKTGDKFRQRIDEAIRIYDKLLVVLSEDSIQSAWVEEEVEGALEKERKQNKLVLFPVRLDHAVMEANEAWAASLRRTRHIGDFTRWKDHDPYQKAFQRLLRDLQGEKGKAAK